jgi:hypothetical protein
MSSQCGDLQHRIRHIMDQEVFRIRPVYLERTPVLQKLCLGIYRVGKLIDYSSKTNGLKRA